MTETSIQVQSSEVMRVASTLSLDPRDSTNILNFGTQAQQGASQVADSMLAQVKVKDVSGVGDGLTELMSKCKSLDVSDITKKSGLGNIPLIGKFMDKTQSFITRHNKLVSEIDSISDRLRNAQTSLTNDVKDLDKVYAHNEQTYYQLELHSQAAKLKLQELESLIQNEQNQPSDNMQSMQTQDLLALKDRLERKINDLELSKMIAVQTAPQIRLIQNNNQVLAEKIQSSINNTIPLWKQQFVIAISLSRQQNAAVLQKNVSDATNALLKSNMDMLKTNSIQIAQEAQRGIVDIQTLEHVNQQLINTFDEIDRIRIEGASQRSTTANTLLKLQGDLKQRMTK